MKVVLIWNREKIGLGTTSYSNEMPNDRGKVVVLCVFISLCGQ